MSQAKRIKLDQCFRMQPVLSDELTEDTPLVPVFVDKIRDPKTTSTVIASLNSCLPLPELSHLKRVCGQEILLFPTEDLTQEENEPHSFLKRHNFDVTLLKNEVRVAFVARYLPKTHHQYITVSKLWSCNFHRDKYIEKLVSNTVFTDHEIEEHERFMMVAITAGKLAREDNLTTVARGVVVTDPKNHSVVAIGYSEISENPCRHSVMVAVHNVAKTQKEVISTSDKSELLNDKLQELFPKVLFGLQTPKCGDETPYLCTGYYVYCTHEPCIMCAMALVHSRAKRVFYAKASSNGGLGTLCKIHTIRDLNHHYEVFANLCGGLVENL